MAKNKNLFLSILPEADSSAIDRPRDAETDSLVMFQWSKKKYYLIVHF